MKRTELIEFWKTGAERDAKVMDDLFSKGNYTWSLFIGHLVIEKLLKAFYIKTIGVDYPRIRDLTRLALKTGIQITNEQKEILDKITSYNIEVRYPDYKNDFYKKATRDFTAQALKQIKEMEAWLRQQL
jgi:HEPN domain-containing protein